MKNQFNVLCNTSSYNYSGYPESINLIKNPQKRKLTGDELDQLISAFDPVGIIAGVEPINNDTLKAAKSLKVISRCGIDLETIDYRAARRLGIIVSRYSPGTGYTGSRAGPVHDPEPDKKPEPARQYGQKEPMGKKGYRPVKRQDGRGDRLRNTGYQGQQPAGCI